MRLFVVSFVFFENYDSSTCSCPLIRCSKTVDNYSVVLTTLGHFSFPHQSLITLINSSLSYYCFLVIEFCINSVKVCGDTEFQHICDYLQYFKIYTVLRVKFNKTKTC